MSFAALASKRRGFDLEPAFTGELAEPVMRETPFASLLRAAGIVVLTLASALAANTARTDGGFSRPVYPQRQPLPDLPLRHVDTLVVNTFNEDRTIAEDKCEVQGVREIFELLKRSSYEEMWLFVPARDGSHGCRWIEIGRTAISTDNESTIRVDRTFLTKAMMRYDQLYLYHFHPLKYFERCKSDADCDELSLPRAAGQISPAGLIANLRYAMPSPEDIYFMMDVVWEFRTRRGDVGKLINKVVTPYGVIEYAMTPAGWEKFRRERSQREAGLYIKLVAANALYDDNINAIIRKQPDDVHAAVRALARSLNSKYVTVVLTPVDQLQRTLTDRPDCHAATC